MTTPTVAVAGKRGNMAVNRATDARPPFFQIEDAVIDDYDLHPLAGWLYVVIVRHINRKKNDAFPSITRLAKIAKMSKASVLRYTKVLEEKGLIEVIREKDDTGEKQVNHYRLLTATRVVSDRDYGSSSQQQPVVSDSNINQKKINQSNLTTEEQEIAPQSVAAEPPTNIIPFQSNPSPDTSAEVDAVSLVPPAAPRKPRKASDWQLVVGLCMDIWKCESGLAGKYAQMLTGKAKGNNAWAQAKLAQPTNERELKGWYRWLTQGKRELPQAAWQVQQSFTAFRASAAYEDAIRDANAPPAPPPEPEPEATPEMVAEARARRDAAVQQFLNRHRIGGKEAIRGKQSEPAA